MSADEDFGRAIDRFVSWVRRALIAVAIVGAVLVLIFAA